GAPVARAAARGRPGGRHPGVRGPLANCRGRGAPRRWRTPVSGALLEGQRVVELADEQAEYVGLLLAGLGAEVIKVEPPEGNATRGTGPFLDDTAGGERSLHFWAYNRGKRSVALDLSGPRGRHSLRELLASADVFVESTPHGFLDELGLGADELASAFPALVA